MNPKIIIAIDGHSSCGKSTLAKDLARKLSYVYIDSGAMYRAVTLYCIMHKRDINDLKALEETLSEIDIDIKTESNSFLIFLNGEEVTQRIIAIDVSEMVSQVAAISIVRRKMVDIQKSFSIDKGVVMDGRDIGTVVFPDAEVKLFITASIDIRTHRRYDELKEKGMETPFDQVKDNLKSRDHIDSTRKDSPLKMANDAILIDNSFMDREEQVFLSHKIALEAINKIKLS